MEPRRCGVHGLVVNADGRCVICRRGDPETEPAKTSQEWPVVVAIGFAAALLVFSGGYWLTRKLGEMNAKPPPVTAVVETAEPSATVDEGLAKYPQSVSTVPKLGAEATRPPSPAPEITQEELDRRKRTIAVTMYASPKCDLCQSARTFMKARGYKLTELDVEASPTDKVLLQNINPAGTVPTFDVEGKVLVGYDRQVLDRTIEDLAMAKLKR